MSIGRTAWRDETHALIKRIDRIPDQAHPAVKPLLDKLDALLAFGLEHEYITPKGAARL